ncbi:3-phosphoshikimate 1-carboxyvinyltransferase [Flavobacterium microcysteis]|uniref:3-phosphoshikimate 1-carboxyvinyltransferase n=1 Tax=Flavobacterium microcysteis TaxID=2596891 RepID=A0A501Q7U4_9FLAO|nr:3-phosphoshikimate 1-carboxyvinyltransferase [Flavobacterium microcysteis]TPD68227.1 3-phosphoshikimate 1-carboxyvinyltransferase [Flavobacterium microcysteis]
MNLSLKPATCHIKSEISITGSKSETNRLLLLQALYPAITLKNTSNSDDSEVMDKALKTKDSVVDVHHAGTAMRFLTAYFATREGREVILTGSSRMKERPIKILVDALNQLGAAITYEEKEGFPPIKIKGQQLSKNKVSLPATISSQYISALLLIAPKLENGLELQLQGKITSVPYIKMTLALLEEIGVKTDFKENTIHIQPKKEVQSNQLTVESDWSSASYFYSITALSKIGTEIKLSSYKQHSLQGDSVLAEIYKELGVDTSFDGNAIILRKNSDTINENLVLNLNDSPDIAQTIAVTCFGLGITCHLSGLHTLKIKETDRLEALKTELQKLGAAIKVTEDTLELGVSGEIKSDISIATYDDHRMAMAFAPLAIKVPIIIKDAGVVSKSYPGFWEDLKSIGFQMDKI